MVAADGEHAIAAQQVEIALSFAVVEILAASLAKADIIPDGPQHSDHLLVEMAGMQIKAFGFVGVEQACNIDLCG